MARLYCSIPVGIYPETQHGIGTRCRQLRIDLAFAKISVPRSRDERKHMVFDVLDALDPGGTVVPAGAPVAVSAWGEQRRIKPDRTQNLNVGEFLQCQYRLVDGLAPVRFVRHREQGG